MQIARVTTDVFALALLAALTMGPRVARADGGCKRDGQQCATNMSCCSRNCMKPMTAPSRRPLFGMCCTRTTCAAQGATCGAIRDGDCGDMLTCGTCDASACLTCGASHTCVSACTSGQVCFQSGCCTPATCGAQDCGMLSDGCGGTLDCGACPTTTTTTATSSTTTTTTLPACDPNAGATISCTCGDGHTACAVPGNIDCTGPAPSCASKQADCSAFCAPFGGAGPCGTTPCIDCTTHQPCQDAPTG
jgi:hypothetical protein